MSCRNRSINVQCRSNGRFLYGRSPHWGVIPGGLLGGVYIKIDMSFYIILQVFKLILFKFFFFFWFLISQEFIICSEKWFGHSIYHEYQHFAAASRLPRRPLPLAWIIILSACSLYLSLKLFDNSWCNTYIPCLSVLIAHRFTCGEKKIW